MFIKDLIKHIIETKVLKKGDIISEFTMYMSGDITLDGTKLNFNGANIRYEAALADAYRHEHEIPKHCRYTIEMKGHVIWWRDFPNSNSKNHSENKPNKEFFDYVLEYKHFIIPIAVFIGACYQGYAPLGVAFIGYYIIARCIYLLIVMQYGDFETFLEILWKNIVDFFTQWYYLYVHFHQLKKACLSA